MNETNHGERGGCGEGISKSGKIRIGPQIELILSEETELFEGEVSI